MQIYILYNRFGPWFTEPVIAGLTEDNKPFLSGMDLIGAPVFTNDFVVAGTCTSNLHGMCEAMYRPNMVRNKCVFAFQALNWFKPSLFPSEPGGVVRGAVAESAGSCGSRCA